jgi:hypothetical protein
MVATVVTIHAEAAKPAPMRPAPEIRRNERLKRVMDVPIGLVLANTSTANAMILVFHNSLLRPAVVIDGYFYAGAGNAASGPKCGPASFPIGSQNDKLW